MKNRKGMKAWFNLTIQKSGLLALKGISHLPFRLLYVVSDFTSIFLQYMIRYRRQVIISNITASFPGISGKELNSLVRKFYRHFADITVETIKGYTISWESLMHRISVQGIESLNAHYENGRSVLLFCMHYNNWEWTNCIQKLTKHDNVVIYNPMRNSALFEDFLLKIRDRWGAKSIPVHKSGRFAMQFHKTNKPVLLGLVADQRPPFNTPYWTIFMEQETCFNTGPVKIARSTNQPVYFLHVRKIKRGHYEYSFIPLIDNPSELESGEILLRYVKAMEECIREAPEYYLWSHRRWKLKRPEGYSLIGE
jgi:KDO2-lipid IV(A) lauroyltransferase